MLQAGSSPVRDSMMWMIFFLDVPNPSGWTRPWGSLKYQKHKKIMFLGSKVRRVRRADNPTTIYEPIV
jgi:hypothetical protein